MTDGTRPQRYVAREDAIDQAIAPAQLAARRDEITQRTLARLRRESAEEQERQRRLDFLECLYIQQGGTDNGS